MKPFISFLLVLILFSCSKHENRMEGSWFVNYFINDSKTEDFTLVLNEGGTGEKNGLTEVTWSVSKSELTLIMNDDVQKWENNKNKKDIQFYLSNDSLGNYLRMEMERIK
ncbi:MAG: hypothetical protein CMP67_01245 [Flavobacteriales bacterium]|nr:hypothetical protein [Flavobacteriales bacterium]